MAGELMLESPTGGLDSTLGEILAQLRRLTPVDAAGFLVVDWPAGTIRPAAAWFASDGARAALEPLMRRPYEPEHPGITEEALESGGPVLLRSIAQWRGAAAMRERLERDHTAEQVELTWSWYRDTSLIACPVSTPEGRPLGVLCLSASPPLAPLDEEAVRHVRVFADLAGLALDRASLLEDEARRAREELLLSHAAAAVSESLDREVVEQRVVEQALAITGAEKALLTRLRPELGLLEGVVNRGFCEETASGRYAVGEGIIGEVAASRVPRRWSQGEGGMPLRSVLERERIGSVLHVPMVLGPRLWGVISAAHGDAAALGERELHRLVRLAQAAAAALANAAEHEHERRVARALAGSLAPVSDEGLEGVSVAVRYEPAGTEGVGGDFYGAWPAGARRTAILIGDVVGKGVEVAALAAMVRFFIEARLPDASGPADALAQADVLLRTRLSDERFATAWLGVLEGQRLTWSNAGHPAPLVVGRAGSRTLEVPPAPPLGIGDRAARPEDVTELAAGDTLLTFTDGLLEARRGAATFAGPPLEAAVARAAAAGTPPRELVDALVGAAHDWAGQLDDDVTVLAVAPVA